MRYTIGRRQFLRLLQGALVTVAGGLLPRWSIAAERKPVPGRTRVVSVSHPRASDGDGRDNINLNAGVLDEMVNRGVMALTGKVTSREAWRQIIPDPTKKVAIKVNCQIEGIYTKNAVVQPIVAGLLAIGVPPENVFIYDKRDTAFHLAGFRKNLGPGVQVGTVDDFGGYSRFFFDRLANLLTGGYGNSIWNMVARWQKGSSLTLLRPVGSLLLDGRRRPFDCEYLINVPVLKALDGYSGVSLSMKNHFGSIGNPGDHHHELMEYLPHLNNRPEIRNKTRLIVLDAIFGEYKWINGRDQTYVDTFNKVLFGTDPVAIDYLGWQMLEAKRHEKGVGPVSPQPAFIRKAAKRGLGLDDPDKIDTVDISLKS